MFRRFGRIPKQVSDITKTAKDLKQNNRVSKAIYMQRLDECSKCVYSLKSLDICRKCGCFVKVKALSPSMECPLGKWLLGDAPVDITKTQESNHNPDEEN